MESKSAKTERLPLYQVVGYVDVVLVIVKLTAKSSFSWFHARPANSTFDDGQSAPSRPKMAGKGTKLDVEQLGVSSVTD